MQALLIINEGFLLVSKGYGVGAALFYVNRGIIYHLFLSILFIKVYFI